MLFSQTTEYALRAMVFLADDGQEPQVTSRIAEKTRVPAGYLSKVLQSLRRAALVHAQRGLGGGWMLARAPAAISILDIVNAVDPIRRITTCPLGLGAHGKNLCALHRKLDDAMAHVENVFRTATLDDILQTPGKSKPLCDVPIHRLAIRRR